MECIWRIRVPKEYRVSFVFLAPINLDPNCTDVLEVRDGLDVTSPLLNRYCGSTKAPPNIFSSGRALFVRFKSDSYLRGFDGLNPGFRATYFATRVKSGAAFFKTSLSLIPLLVFLFKYCWTIETKLLQFSFTKMLVVTPFIKSSYMGSNSLGEYTVIELHSAGRKDMQRPIENRALNN